MNARNALLAASALLTVTLGSCGTLNRAGKDAMIGVASVPLWLYGGATDGYQSARDVRSGLQGGSVVEVVSFPFTFAYHTLKHVIYWGIHVVDLPLCGLYWMAEVHPYGPEIKPLDFYQGTIFDQPAKKKSGTDAESGEQLPPNYGK